MREDYEIDFLDQEVTHWMKRAKNIGSEDFKSRYERIGTYSVPATIEKRYAGSPWKVEATPTELSITKKLRWKPTLHRVYPKKAEATKISWSSPFQALPVLGSDVGTDATLILWRYKDNVAGGQAVVTNGENYWLFQAIGSNKPITKRDRGNKPIQVSEPVIVGHLQRSEIVIKPDKSKLTEGLRKRAEFVASPFSEMSEAKLEGYQSSYRRGRANILAVAGEPATGKSFVMKQLIAKANDWKPARFGKVLDYTHSKALNLYILGVYTPGEKFPGTDKLSMDPYDDVEKFIRTLATKPINIVWEGDRLLRERVLKCALSNDTNLAILRFKVSKAVKAQRHSQRQDTQKIKFITSRETLVERICQSPEFWDCVEEVRNESTEDNARILKMIDWFLGERSASGEQSERLSA